MYSIHKWYLNGTVSYETGKEEKFHPFIEGCQKRILKSNIFLTLNQEKNKFLSHSNPFFKSKDENHYASGYRSFQLSPRIIQPKKDTITSMEGNRDL